jgi:membrane protease YdiL (CAAX protease family)
MTTKTLFGITSAILFLFLASLVGSSIILKLQGLDKANATTLFLSRIVFWVCILLLWLYAAKVEKRGLLIWEDAQYKFPKYMAHVAILLVATFLVFIPISLMLQFTGSNQLSPKLAEIKSMLQGSRALVLFVVLTAGVTEEIVFRGYIQPRLQNVFKSPYLSIVTTSILFGLLHYGYGTITNIVGPLAIGIVFSTYYWKFRNLKVLIICHILIDLIALNALLRHP